MKTAFLVIAALASSASTAAQTTFATITGMVTDPQGAAISGAQVTATLVSSNYEYKTRSNELGYYTLGQLLQGEYTLRVEMQGFGATLVKDILLTAQEQRRIDVQLNVSTVSTTVEVRSTAASIETESARISDTKLASQIKNLPLNTRSLWNFVGQNPGIVTRPAARQRAGSRAAETTSRTPQWT